MTVRIPGKMKLISLAAAPVMALAVLAASGPSSARADLEQAPPAPPPPIHAAAAGIAPPAPPAPPTPPAQPAPPAEHRRGDRYRHDRRAWLGIVLSGEDGTQVRSVAEDSPAEEAGLEKGDRILEIEGEEIEDGQDIFRAMRSMTPGDRVRIRVERDGEEKSLSATLGNRRESFRGELGPRVIELHHEDGDNDGDDEDMHRLRERHEIVIPGPGRNYLGVEILMMSDELRSALGAPRGNGVLVNKVVDGSPADEGGVRAGDIIVSVDGEAVEDAGDIGMALREHEPGEEVDVKVIRDGSERTLAVKVERRPGRQGRRGSFGWEGLSEEDKQELKRTIDEAMKQAGEAMKQAGEAMKQAHGQMKIQGLELREMQEQLREQNQVIREQIRKQMEEVRATVRARKVHDI